MRDDDRPFIDPHAPGNRWKNTGWVILLIALWMLSIALATPLPEWTPPL